MKNALAFVAALGAAACDGKDTSEIIVQQPQKQEALKQEAPKGGIANPGEAAIFSRKFQKWMEKTLEYNGTLSRSLNAAESFFFDQHLCNEIGPNDANGINVQVDPTTPNALMIRYMRECYDGPLWGTEVGKETVAKDEQPRTYEELNFFRESVQQEVVRGRVEDTIHFFRDSFEELMGKEKLIEKIPR